MSKEKMPTFGRIILAGNPNVGKSTLFNHLTQSKVHTGNWSGKTVSVSTGCGVHKGKKYIFSDLPGIASLSCPDAEELSAFSSIMQEDYDCCIIVADATNLSCSLALTLRILEITSRCVLCINFADQAKKKSIKIDVDALKFILGIPVVLISAEKKKGIDDLMDACEEVCKGNFSSLVFTPLYTEETENFLASFSRDRKDAITKLYFLSDSNYSVPKKEIAIKISSLASKITKTTLFAPPPKESKADKILCSPFLGLGVMLLLLCVILFFTITLSNYPSQFLAFVFKKGEGVLLNLFSYLSLPPLFENALVFGVYSVTTTVISVMLPPMVIFFPFFTLLEDLGYLPRIAFNLDGAFKRCGSCGKQALTVCMGLGCNCVGISAGAIIPSKRERLISIITNSLTPCNGRFGAIIVTVSIFLSASQSLLSAFFVMLVLVFSFAATFFSSYLLSKTLLRGEKSAFILDLPPYRKPYISKAVLRTITDRICDVLFRAAAVAAPLGGVIYILNHFNLLFPIARFLNPFATLMGLDGIILLSFILAFPANEIVFPIMLMLYTNSNIMTDLSASAMEGILMSQGWMVSTAVSFIIFTLMHWPCFPAFLMIKKETGSIKWTVVSFLLPLVLGVLCCFVSNFIFSLFGV